MNAFHHAPGAPVLVGCHQQAGRVTVLVADEGPGIAGKASDMHAKGLGLAGLRERVESIGGVFELDTAPDRGTRLTIRLVLDGMS